jgi:ferredoxin
MTNNKLQRLPDPAIAPGNIAFRACVYPGEFSFDAPPSMPLLQAAEQAGTDDLRLDSSCRNGSCRTCICRLISGKVAYRIEWPGLSAEEKRDGYILPCVAHPLSDVVIELLA